MIDLSAHLFNFILFFGRGGFGKNFELCVQSIISGRMRERRRYRGEEEEEKERERERKPRRG